MRSVVYAGVVLRRCAGSFDCDSLNIDSRGAEILMFERILSCSERARFFGGDASKGVLSADGLSGLSHLQVCLWRHAQRARPASAERVSA